jgi:acetoin:2,6-dichlorophenolindophenol oxidoreductase subunit alpha
VWSLPVVFVCQNNRYGEFTPLTETQRVDQLSTRAAGYGLPGVTVDGNDVLAVRAATAAAAERARRGEGPTLLHCQTFRWLFHAMRDAPPPETRSAELLAEWRRRDRDPITRFEDYLTSQKILGDAELVGLRGKVKGDLQAAVDFAEASPYPEPKDLLTDMFAE